ncbi:MAG: hypothetical protein RL153_866 [Verrucomicrobiota bacterium]
MQHNAVMIRNPIAALVAILPLLGAAQATLGAVFTDPTPYLTGNAPSGIAWTTVATGTSLPVRSGTSASSNGKPGAVAYYNVKTGQLSLDPKGWSISLFNFTYTSGTNNTSSTTPGPFRYASGNNPTTLIVSGATGAENQRTVPAGTWTLLTAHQARIAGSVSLVQIPTLASTYDAGNGAGSATTPYSTNPAGEAVVAGWFTQPWAFPADLVDSASRPNINMAYWKAFGVSGNANANILGYGNYAGVFQYVINGVVGNQVGPVIPFFIPDPTTTTLQASPSPSTYGSSVTLEATVTPSSATGTVTFKDGTTVLGTATLSGGVATLTTSARTTGAHSLTAEYGGDTAMATAAAASVSSSVSHTVDKATPSITTAPVASDIIEGQTLESSTLGGGVASVPGDFAFTTPSTQPALGTSSQSVTFTPADSDNYLATTLTVNVNVNPVPNLAPVPGNPSVTRSTPGLRVSLLLLATDAEYDLLVFSNLTSSIGATVKISGQDLVYQAPTSNDTRGDTVSYVVSDGISTASGTLTVTYSDPTGGQAASISVVGGSVSVRFAGIPGVSYRVQRADDVGFTSNPSVSAPFSMPASGVYLYSDPAPPASSAYYQLVGP